MVRDALRGYLQVATGLTEVTRQRAMSIARGLVAQGESAVEQIHPGQVREQVQALAEDIVTTSKTNRDLLVALVRQEVERTVARLGLAAGDDVDRLARSVDRLARSVERLEAESGGGAARRPSSARPRTAGAAASARGVAKQASRSGAKSTKPAAAAKSSKPAAAAKSTTASRRSSPRSARGDQAGRP